MERPVLDPIDQRILGALAEKERTVPATYPLSLNALRSACNQSTSRDPVSEYTDADLETAARALKERGLLRIVWAGKGSRTLKYHQLLTEVLDLEEDERALLTVLLLRGPQSAGELKTRAERLHPFADRADVEAVLARLADRADPLVARLQRQAGQHDPRWVHRLGPLPDSPAPAAAAAPQTGVASTPGLDRDVVLIDGAPARDARVRAAYDAVAVEYADRHRDDLTVQPFERWLLERVAEDATGPVVVVGCGAGHHAAFLADAGADVTGIDVSEAMVACAREEVPDLTVEVGDARRLLKPPRATGWSAALAWDLFSHLSGSELPEVISALARTLAPGGRLALAVRIGEEVRHVTSWWGHAVDLHDVLHDPRTVRAAVAACGLVIEEWYVRAPRPEVEDDTEWLHVFARR